MQFGIMFANTGHGSSPEGAKAVVQAAEAGGFTTAWTVEHVVVPSGYESKYPYDSSGKMAGGAEEFDLPVPLIWLTWAAAHTTTLRLGTGILIATVYRFGSYWGTGVFVPHVQSLFVLQPRPELLAPLPFILQFHASLFFVFLVVFPFSRLVHIITFPLRYLTRPFQLVKWLRRDRPVSSEREPVGAGRV